LYEQIKTGSYSFPDHYWGNISAQAKEVVCALLTVEPDQRMTCEQLLSCTWITGDAPDTELGDDYQKKLRLFNARRKLRKAIMMILALNKLARNIASFDSMDSGVPENMENNDLDVDSEDLKE